MTMRNELVFIDEPVTHFSENSMRILFDWMSQNERQKSNLKILMNPITEEKWN